MDEVGAKARRVDWDAAAEVAREVLGRGGDLREAARVYGCSRTTMQAVAALAGIRRQTKEVRALCIYCCTPGCPGAEAHRLLLRRACPWNRKAQREGYA